MDFCFLGRRILGFSYMDATCPHMNPNVAHFLSKLQGSSYAKDFSNDRIISQQFIESL